MPETTPARFRRVIGPIPPRDSKRRLKLAPVPGKRVKTNALGEPIRDKEGQPVMEDYDTRDWREYYNFEAGQHPAEGATKGLRLFQIDLSKEPLVQVYARDERHAEEVWKAEMGILFINPAEMNPPRITEIS